MNVFICVDNFGWQYADFCILFTFVSEEQLYGTWEEALFNGNINLLFTFILDWILTYLQKSIVNNT